jgi:hypothetical protein
MVVHSHPSKNKMVGVFLLIKFSPLKEKHFFFNGLEFVGHSFAYVAHFVLLRDVWI